MAKSLGKPDMIFFGGGEPTPDLFPYAPIRATFEAILGDPLRASAALQYSGSEGLPALRDWVAARVSQTGVSCRRENVLITAGSQQGLDFMGRLFINEGTPVWVQRPTYSGALQAFSAHGADFRTMFEARRVAASPSSGMAYVIVDSQNPTGCTMSVAQRQSALDFAGSLRVPVIEDDAYAGLQFAGEVLPSLLQLALNGKSVDDGAVLQLGTFSKCLVPGLRVAWVIAPAVLIQRLTWIKQGADLQVSALSQMAAYDLANMASGEHVAKLASAYCSRRDAMLAALDAEFGAKVIWTRPVGGFFIWMTLPEGVDAGAEVEKAIEAGVVYVPGQSFHADGSGANTLRLSFSTMSEERIREGIRRLATVLLPAIERATPNTT
jgi:hypothetical protein